MTSGSFTSLLQESLGRALPGDVIRVSVVQDTRLAGFRVHVDLKDNMRWDWFIDDLTVADKRQHLYACHKMVQALNAEILRHKNARLWFFNPKVEGEMQCRYIPTLRSTSSAIEHVLIC